MTLHHPRKPTKPRFPWSAGCHRSEAEGPRPHTAPISETWKRISPKQLEGIRLSLGLSEIEMANLLGIEKQALRALQRGPGFIIGPAVKLLALLRSMPPEMRAKAIAYLVSSEKPKTTNLTSHQD